MQPAASRDPRFPIGKFQYVPATTAQERDARIEVIAQLPAKVSSAVKGIAEAQLETWRTKYCEGRDRTVWFSRETKSKRGVWGYVRGGMGGLTQALAKAAQGLGVDIRCNTEVSRIQTNGGAVRGVAELSVIDRMGCTDVRFGSGAD